jgi:hypothetical protein
MRHNAKQSSDTVPRRPRLKWAMLHQLLLLLWLIGWPAMAVSNDTAAAPTEDRIKAAFLYKFAGYVEWPEGKFENAQAPIVIGVLGAEPIAEALLTLTAGRTIANRSMLIKRISIGDPINDLHILFIGDSQRSHLRELAPQLQAHSVLTVTESEDALAHGSIINFLIMNQRVKFDVSLESAEKSKLRLSSRLLAVAHEVLGAH